MLQLVAVNDPPVSMQLSPPVAILWGACMQAFRELLDQSVKTGSITTDQAASEFNRIVNSMHNVSVLLPRGFPAEASHFEQAMRQTFGRSLAGQILEYARKLEAQP